MLYVQYVEIIIYSSRWDFPGNAFCVRCTKLGAFARTHKHLARFSWSAIRVRWGDRSLARDRNEYGAKASRASTSITYLLQFFDFCWRSFHNILAFQIEVDCDIGLRSEILLIGKVLVLVAGVPLTRLGFAESYYSFIDQRWLVFTKTRNLKQSYCEERRRRKFK